MLMVEEDVKNLVALKVHGRVDIALLMVVEVDVKKTIAPNVHRKVDIALLMVLEEDVKNLVGAISFFGFLTAVIITSQNKRPD